MRIALALLATFAIPALAAAPAAASSASIDALVYKVRSEAAWHGVETVRIVRQGQNLKVLGYNRSGRDVVLEMSCPDLGFICESSAGGGFGARPR